MTVSAGRHPATRTSAFITNVKIKRSPLETDYHWSVIPSPALPLDIRFSERSGNNAGGLAGNCQLRFQIASSICSLSLIALHEQSTCKNSPAVPPEVHAIVAVGWDTRAVNILKLGYRNPINFASPYRQGFEGRGRIAINPKKLGRVSISREANTRNAARCSSWVINRPKRGGAACFRCRKGNLSRIDRRLSLFD